MDASPEIIALLERIASALERIADSCARNDAPKTDLHAPHCIQQSLPAILVKSTSSNNDTTRLQTFLATRGVTIKMIPPEQESDEIIDQLSLFIGNKFESVKGVIEAIKTNMKSGKSFSLNLRNASQPVIDDILHLCMSLYNAALITAYHYQNSTIYQLHITPSNNPRALHFFSGQWLERFVKTQVVSILNSKSLKFSYIHNAELLLPNGSEFTLDMLVETEGKMFWLEAKAGDYRKHIEKYSKVAKMIGLNCDNTFMILADSAVTDNLVRLLSHLYGINVVRIDKFAEQITKMLPAGSGEILQNGVTPHVHIQA